MTVDGLPPLHAGEVRVIHGRQMMARPSAVGDHLVWVELPPPEDRATPGLPRSLPPSFVMKLTQAHWTQAHLAMLQRSADEARFRVWMDLEDLPPLPGQP